MAGYVYACCLMGSPDNCKIGYTLHSKQECERAFSRTSYPLEVLTIRPFSDAHLAHCNVVHALTRRCTVPSRRMFDLSGMDGFVELEVAMEHACQVDQQAALCVPEQPAISTRLTRAEDLKQLRQAAERLVRLVAADTSYQ